MIFKTLRKRLLYLFRVDHSTQFYSQGGEDAILFGIFKKKIQRGEVGFYVDVGAYHPYKHSNTYFFYLKNWNGINIDPRPGCMDLFNKLRSKDLNIEIGIGKEKGTTTYYYISSDSPMNSFSKKNLIEQGVWNKVEKEIPVPITTLENILEKNTDLFDEIDLLTIDVEGWDYEVIKSNNWEKFRPNVVVLELSCLTFEDLYNNESAKFLENIGYKIVAKNIIVKNVASVFFVKDGFEY